MEDGTVRIFGLVFAVAATTTSSVAVLVAGASG
jgi:vacuolar iron transporter family protein